MATYKLLATQDGWMLTKSGTGEPVARFAMKAEALRESLKVAHRDGASLVLTPAKKVKPRDGEIRGGLAQ